VNLVEFIEQQGDEACAALWNVKLRTVQSWRRGERTPRKELAKVIVDRSPVTYAGIYQMPESEAA